MGPNLLWSLYIYYGTCDSSPQTSELLSFPSFSSDSNQGYKFTVPNSHPFFNSSWSLILISLKYGERRKSQSCNQNKESNIKTAFFEAIVEPYRSWKDSQPPRKSSARREFFIWQSRRYQQNHPKGNLKDSPNSPLRWQKDLGVYKGLINKLSGE